ncbi:MAG: type I pullulanase, partial [Bacilli bacterium]
YLINRDGIWIEANDPYAKASLLNEGHSIVVASDLVAYDTSSSLDNISYQPCEAIIYELSVYDFTSDDSVDFTNPKTFQGFIEEGVTLNNQAVGFDYLKELGISHIQLLPIFDFGSVDELARLDQYNWGYDPRQYNVIEGLYTTNPSNPLLGIIEFKKLIKKCHDYGIRVNMDVVYNHVYKTKSFTFNKIIPYYFFRVDNKANLSNGSGCGNDVASQRRMVSKFIIDSLMYYATEFNLDGFRFDLMGLLDIETMKQAALKLKSFKQSIMLYGEGWKMDTSYPNELLAHRYNATQLLDYGFFNDKFRDDLKGATFDDYSIGIINGDVARGYNLKDLLSGCSLPKEGGNLFQSPNQSINYVSCHDNHTLYDKLLFTSLNSGLEVLKRQHHLALSIVVLAQGVSLLHGASEFFTSKQGIENSYNAGSKVNMFDWHLMIKNKNYVDYIKELIKIKKYLKVFSLSNIETIKAHVFVDVRGNIIEYSLVNVENAPYQNVKVIFNISGEEVNYQLDNSYLCLVNDYQARIQGLFTTESIKIKGYSVSLFVL